MNIFCPNTKGFHSFACELMKRPVFIPRHFTFAQNSSATTFYQFFCFSYNLFSRNVDLQFAMFLEGCDQPKMVALPFGEGSLLDAMNRVDQVDDLFMGKRDNRYIGSREEYRKTFSSMLQLLLYLCSEEPDMPQIEHPQKRRRICRRSSIRRNGGHSAAG